MMLCIICGRQMSTPGYVGQETCPNCGAVYEYDEGAALKEVPPVVVAAIRKAILAMREQEAHSGDVNDSAQKKAT